MPTAVSMQGVNSRAATHLLRDIDAWDTGLAPASALGSQPISQALCHPHTPKSDSSLSHLQKKGEESLSFPRDVALGIMSAGWGGHDKPSQADFKDQDGHHGPLHHQSCGHHTWDPPVNLPPLSAQGHSGSFLATTSWLSPALSLPKKFRQTLGPTPQSELLTQLSADLHK